MVMWDYMHNMARGVWPWLLAAVLLELCQEGRFGPAAGDRKDSTTLMLRRAWLQFKWWASKHGISHSVPEFTLGSLGMAAGRRAWPELKTKAANCQKILAWVASLCITDPGDTYRQKVRSTCVVAWHKCHLMVTHCPMWFSAEEASEFHDLNACALQ